MKIAVDGKVISGNALVNEAPLTGESVAKEKQIGDTVYAGTFLESGNLFIKTEKIKQETVFGKMTKLLLDAQDKKASLVIITNKIATIFTPLVLCIIALVWIFTGDNNLVTTLLVFGSPLELSLIAPLTLLAGSIAAFKKGILIKSGWALEHMARIDTFIFDKTGTLTKGNPKVIDIQSCNKNYTPQDILQLCAIAQKYSDAAFSRAICHAAEEQKIIVPYPEAYESLVGHGVKITYKNNIYLVGNKHFLEAAEHGNIYFPESIKPSELSGTLFLASEHDLLGFLSLADSIRQEAKEVVKQLRMSGINTIMIVSGDKKAVVEKIAQEVGIDLFYGEMFPEQKLAILEDLQKRGKIVAMVGDGLNDALALKYATVGIALGALGVEPAIEAANIVLMTSNLNQIVFIRKLSQRIVATIYQNLIIGFLCVHILGFLCAMAGYISPITAALFHSLSDILILLNSARLSFKK